MLTCFLVLTLTAGDASVEITPVTPPGPELYNLPMASSRFGLPPGYEKAHQTFEDARAEYEARRFARAAPLFMKVAELVAAPEPKTTYASQFAKMRAAAYEDAALAFGQAEQKAEAKKAFTTALAKDTENSALLQKLIAKQK